MLLKCIVVLSDSRSNCNTQFNLILSTAVSNSDAISSTILKKITRSEYIIILNFTTKLSFLLSFFFKTVDLCTHAN